MSRPLSQPRPRWVGPSDFAKWSSRRPFHFDSHEHSACVQESNREPWEKSSGMHGVGELTCARPEEH